MRRTTQPAPMVSGSEGAVPVSGLCRPSLLWGHLAVAGRSRGFSVCPGHEPQAPALLHDPALRVTVTGPRGTPDAGRTNWFSARTLKLGLTPV